MADYDLVIVGMGSAGLTAAEFAARIELRVAVVEMARPGGDCLWTGCVPSKALLASAKTAHAMRTADRLGLAAVEPEIDTSRVFARIRAVREEIAATDDSPERYRELGAEVISGRARIAGAHAVDVDGLRLDTRFVLVCTGSRPAIPDVPGLSTAGCLTSESVFELERAPASLVVLGGGPIGVELAQAFRRLGVEVTLLQRNAHLLPKDEPELAELLREVLADEGVDVRTGVQIDRVELEPGRKVVYCRSDGRAIRVEADELLVATGRTPNLDGLGLETVGVRVGPSGIAVDDRLRTSVSSIYAAGDVAGRNLFTHSAGFEAAIAVRNMFFLGSSKTETLVPWCTFTDPELAHVGLTEAEARARHGDSVEVHRASLEHSDRARADGHAHGAIVLVTARGKLVGGHILAPAAGEIIQQLTLAIRKGRKLSKLGRTMHVYPTISTSLQLVSTDETYRSARRYPWPVRRAGRRRDIST